MDTNKQNSNDQNEELKIYLTDNSTLQTREEKERDNKVDPRQDRTISVSEDDLNDAQAGPLTGREEADRGDLTSDMGESEEGGLSEGKGIVDRNIQ